MNDYGIRSKQLGFFHLPTVDERDLFCSPTICTRVHGNRVKKTRNDCCAFANYYYILIHHTNSFFHITRVNPDTEKTKLKLTKRVFHAFYLKKLNYEYVIGNEVNV